jgi:hypothetical protein
LPALAATDALGEGTGSTRRSSIVSPPPAVLAPADGTAMIPTPARRLGPPATATSCSMRRPMRSRPQPDCHVAGQRQSRAEWECRGTAIAISVPVRMTALLVQLLNCYQSIGTP